MTSNTRPEPAASAAGSVSVPPVTTSTAQTIERRMSSTQQTKEVTSSVTGLLTMPPMMTNPQQMMEQAMSSSQQFKELATSMAESVAMLPTMTNAQQIVEKMSSCQETKEHASSVTYASASMSTTTATSSKSESIVQSHKSQEKRETTSIVQSFSEQASAETQSVMIYQSQTSPPIQKSFENPMDTIAQKQTKEISDSNTTVTSEVAVAKESITSASEIQETKIQPNPEPKPEPKDTTTEMKSVNNEESRAVCNKIEETKSELNNATEEQTASSNKTSESTQNTKEVTEIENVSMKTNTIESAQMSHESQKIATTTKEVKYKDLVGEKVSKSDTVLQTQTLPVSSGPHVSMVEALTIAPDRPYSPMPCAPQYVNPQPDNPNPQQNNPNPQQNNMKRQNIPLQEDPIPSNPMPISGDKQEFKLPPQPSPMFAQQPNRGITPIPPIKTYNPPESRQAPIPMPAETKPYIPPDFKINIEPKVPREEASSPMVDALTTAPNRPFTPVSSTHPIERGSLREALTIAPDRPYSPMPMGMTSQSQTSSSHYTSTSTVQVQSTSSEIIRPIATQTTTQLTDQIHSEFSSMQNTYKLQSSSNTSAFKPVPAKQVFPPPQPEEFCKLAHFPPISDELKTSFEKSTRSKQEMMISESKIAQQSVVTTSSMSTSTHGFSSVKNAQQFFEHLDQKESLTSTAVRSKSGLHKADKIPPYQKNFDQLPSQRGITPEVCFAPAIPQRPITPTTDPPTKPRDKSQEPKPYIPTMPTAEVPKIPQIKTPVQQSHLQFQRNTPISMTFQPVADEHFLRTSPARSRPTTPSLINKPAPIIPHYQMNLVTVEHIAPETHMYDPSSREGSRSPTPKLRSRSPAQGPPPNPLKAQAPRLKESTPQRHTPHTLLTQATSNLRKEHEMAQKEHQTDALSTNFPKSWVQDQPSVIREQRHSNVGYKSETYNKQNMNIKEDSMINQNYGQRQMQSQNMAEYGNTTVQTTRKTFEEFERTQSAKVIEIRTGGSSSAGYQHIDSNIRPSSINPKQVFPPPIMSMPTQQSSSFNHTNENVSNASRSIESCQPKPSISGANQGPVCDPTPSTGSSVGAAARGKTFGVSSAPKRGRGVLNKAALPGSRVPLCASCNGNIRGPFITALGRIWCPEHFICVNATCRRPLQDIGFVEENGQLYCEYCFEQYIAPACDKCHAKIKGDCLNAIGKHFHPECFNCVYCGKLFGNNPFFLEDGLPYCESDWNELFTTKCFACGFPVEAGDRWVEALNNNYHSQCFNCTVCKKNLEGQSFFAKGGRPFCKTHAR
ncbi:PDZ and LIM domain protein Zasp isoform X1 [Ostrinia furnacalis]|uniref:PDZ and LIM domain protein Zasp isoform X1 n=1 Tax=Ostrinia furnacalis TaxID=93504 RepID=UPI001039A8EE|nr:PDZ and LIM domain protein Zasp isoform X1 [Ostrinia furnacalis]